MTFHFQLQNQGKSVCLDRMGVPYGNEIGASGCHGFSSNQAWRVTEGKELPLNQLSDLLRIECATAGKRQCLRAHAGPTGPCQPPAQR